MCDVRCVFCTPQHMGFSETSDFNAYHDLGHFNVGRMRPQFRVAQARCRVQITQEELDRLQQVWGFKL